MFSIPSLVLRKLYTYGSLQNTINGPRFEIKNRLSDASIVEVLGAEIDGITYNPEQITLEYPDGSQLRASEISTATPLQFGLKDRLVFQLKGAGLGTGKHAISFSVLTEKIGRLNVKVEDSLGEHKPDRVRVPVDKENDYSEKAIKDRQGFVADFSGKKLEHLPHYSFAPEMLKGNIEAFTGVAQIPVGFAGPIKVNGEYAQGEFLIPLATTEGTLVASYNRGIKAVNLSGGVKCTVSVDCMQRAPVFIFDSARDARDFVDWINKPQHQASIREQAEGTTSIGKLLYIDSYLSNKFAYLRFNYSTGDAAGQNMVGRATFAACSWILDHYPGKTRFFLESNFATDKKASQVNVMRTRGKRVTAEAVLKRDTLIEVLRVEPESLQYHNGVSTIGAFMSGANNNGAHSPNAITAMFIALGQDVANVAESSAGILYSEITPEGDLYISLTIPSLIVASYGGGTSLATQRECLEVMDCYGKGRARKLAEIIAGVALAGELSLGAAISSLDWVSSHEKYGRNR